MRAKNTLLLPLLLVSTVFFGLYVEKQGECSVKKHTPYSIRMDQGKLVVSFHRGGKPFVIKKVYRKDPQCKLKILTKGPQLFISHCYSCKKSSVVKVSVRADLSLNAVVRAGVLNILINKGLNQWKEIRGSVFSGSILSSFPEIRLTRWLMLVNAKSRKLNSSSSRILYVHVRTGLIRFTQSVEKGKK